MERRAFAAELRGEGRTLAGVVLRYGDVADLGPGVRETFAPGAFGPDVHALDVILNVQHERTRPIARTGGGGLELEDSPAALELRAELPDTQEARDAIELVRSRVLRGLSIEFDQVRDRWSGPNRTVLEARLRAVGLVDIPAYNASTVALRCPPRRREWTYL